MAKAKKYPTVVIVGRMNVGKSTLFNRLTSKTKSIIYDYEGVTRDYIHDRVEWDNKVFNLIDTGGLKLTNTNDEILKEVKSNVLALFEKADLFLLMCDVKNGLTQEDRQLATMIHRTKKPVMLLLNKADNKKMYEENMPEFYGLGIEKMIPISATHGSGIATLLDEVTEQLPEAKYVDEKADFRVAIIGKPNAGKSSLMNLLMKEERSIVSSVAGTTRESISEKVNFYQTNIQLTDTAGIRRKARISDDLEIMMVKNAFKSARDAHIVLVMIDASQGRISDQELKLMFYAFEQNKSVIILFNKMDLVDEEMKEQLSYQLEEYDFFFRKGTDHVDLMRHEEKCWQHLAPRQKAVGTSAPRVQLNASQRPDPRTLLRKADVSQNESS